MNLFFLFSLFFLGCSHYSKNKYPKLFPFGTYKHLVTIKTKKDRFSFQGINRSSPQELVLIALGAFNITLLKYKEEYTSLKKEIYVDKKLFSFKEEQLMFYLSVFKDIYALDRSICHKNKCHKRLYGQDFFFNLKEENLGEVSKIYFSRGSSEIEIEIIEYNEK